MLMLLFYAYCLQTLLETIVIYNTYIKNDTTCVFYTEEGWKSTIANFLLLMGLVRDHQRDHLVHLVPRQRPMEACTKASRHIWYLFNRLPRQIRHIWVAGPAARQHNDRVVKLRCAIEPSISIKLQSAKCCVPRPYTAACCCKMAKLPALSHSRSILSCRW